VLEYKARGCWVNVINMVKNDVQLWCTMVNRVDSGK
jgi:hypothetical protein